MPEGPETRRMADKIGDALVGEKIISHRFFHDNLLQLNKMRAISVEKVYSISKAIVIRLSQGVSIISHNQLYGKWTFHRPKTRINSNRQLRIKFETKSKIIRLWSATDVRVLKSTDELKHPYISKLGPDVLDENTTELVILERLKGKNSFNRQLSSVLLDQAIVSGLGNYLRSEILYFCGLNYKNKPSELNQSKLFRLSKSIKDVSIRAYVQKGRTIDIGYFEHEFGNRSNFGKIRHMVFSRDKQPCFKCGARIIKMIVSKRRIFSCPVCQKLDK